jgi:hypothetical protein
MKFKVLAPFQTINRFYQDNLAMNWKLEEDHLVSNKNNFHYFKYLEIDTSWEFEYGKQYIFPIYYEAEATLMDDAINFVREHQELFYNHTLIPVFLDPLEGNDYIAPDIDYFSNTFHNSFPVYFISGDYRLKYRKNLFRFVYNDQWIQHVEPLNTPIDYTPEKTFINLNRVARFHRCLLMQSLIDSNLKDKGYNTWADTYGAYDEFTVSFPNNTIKQQTYDILDVQDISQANPTLMTPVDFCKKTMIYLTTETHVDNNVLFVSEKTYKPISIGMPFMTLGNPGTLEYLREKGFITFSQWVDEKYDLNYPLEKRIRIIISNLAKLDNMSEKKKIKVRKEMQEICQHNLDLYKLLQKKNSLIENLKLIETGNR